MLIVRIPFKDGNDTLNPIMCIEKKKNVYRRYFRLFRSCLEDLIVGCIAKTRTPHKKQASLWVKQIINYEV